MSEAFGSLANFGNLNKTSGDTLPDFNQGPTRMRNNIYSHSIDVSKLHQGHRRKPFVPLKDLLQKNHEDRVREYLDKMKGLTIDEIVNTSILNKVNSAAQEEGKTQRSMFESPMGGVRTVNQSPMSVGPAPKRVNIVESARQEALNLSTAL